MKDRHFNSAPFLGFSFSQIARAVMQPRSAAISFRNAQTARAVSHTPMEMARTAFMQQRYMSRCYMPTYW